MVFIAIMLDGGLFGVVKGGGELAPTEGEGFGEVGGFDEVGTREVGDGLGDFDGFEIGASGEV